MPDNAIIPFGKYKGQPVEVLAADAGYRDWILAQSWFREKHVNLYQTVINYGGAPQDSPEHNQMQALFLEESYCLRLARLLWPSRKFEHSASDPNGDATRIQEYRPALTEKWYDPAVDGRQFEADGWDVAFSVAGALYEVKIERPPCRCDPCDHTDCPEDAKCENGWRCLHRGHERRDTLSSHHDEFCLWSRMDQQTFYWLREKEHNYQYNWEGRALIELKPDLGDDFPSVLRQVMRYPKTYRDRPCVIIRRAAFEHVTWEQVVSIFQASGIKLIHEEEFAL